MAAQRRSRFDHYRDRHEPSLRSYPGANVATQGDRNLVVDQ